MQTQNYKEDLFNSVVSILVTRINEPYKTNREIETYSDLAEVLNSKGFTTERGKEFNKENLKKFFQGINKFEYRDKFLPDCIDDNNEQILYSKYEDLVFIRNPYALKDALGVH